MEIKSKINYQKSGVNYQMVDPLKIFAQKEGTKTAVNLKTSGFMEIPQSRGESAFVIEARDCYYATVIEGLGTKNLIADELFKLTGKSYYDVIAQDTVAMIVNDLITVGAKPLLVNAYWAVGSSDWFSNKKRTEDLVNGWREACNLSGVVWGGGETPVLKGVIQNNTVDLAGSAFGVIVPKSNLITGEKLKIGDDIVFLGSSGIHSNGLTLARRILKHSQDKTKLAKLLLMPTLIYVKTIQELISAKINIHYLVNITGHGFKKLMRAKKSYTYKITNPGKVPEVFKILQKEGRISDTEMYSTFNMGAGFAVFTNPNDTDKILKISKKNKINAWLAGKVVKGRKQVIIDQLKIIFQETDLRIRS